MATDLSKLGYSEKLYILAFDHRGSYVKKWIGGDYDTMSDEVRQRAQDGKNIIFDGMVLAAQGGEDPSTMGVLVDEEFGEQIAPSAKEHGLKLAMPTEATGKDYFEFEYGDDFGKHIERFDPHFVKVLVRYNPDEEDDPGNQAQFDRLKTLSDWLHERDRKFLFELLVPATDQQLDGVSGDKERYDVEHRPDLMVESIKDFQERGIEPDVWKIEGVSSEAACKALADQARADGRDGVTCVLLGRGADDKKVDQWLTAAAPVDGFIGFAIGRSIWGDPLKAYLDGSTPRDEAAAKIAENYTRFIKVYRDAE